MLRTGPDTVCFVTDPTRSGAVLARHAGIDEDTGRLTADQDGGPRRRGTRTPPGWRRPALPGTRRSLDRE